MKPDPMDRVMNGMIILLGVALVVLTIAMIIRMAS